MAYQPLNNQSLQNQIQQYQQLLERTNRKIEQVVSETPIVGLRVWKVVDDKGLPKLRSVYKETVWPYRKALEKDILENMGIHAVKPGRRGSPSIADPAGLNGGMDVLSLFASYEADVAGEVYLWGRVEEHTEGYLAEFAYPKKLYPHADFDPVVAMQLEDEYGVPCEYREEFKKREKVVQPPMLYPQSLQMQMMQGLQQAQNSAALYGMGFYRSPFGL